MKEQLHTTSTIIARPSNNDESVSTEQSLRKCTQLRIDLFSYLLQYRDKCISSCILSSVSLYYYSVNCFIFGTEQFYFLFVVLLCLSCLSILVSSTCRLSSWDVGLNYVLYLRIINNTYFRSANFMFYSNCHTINSRSLY